MTFFAEVAALRKNITLQSDQMLGRPCETYFLGASGTLGSCNRFL